MKEKFTKIPKTKVIKKMVEQKTKKKRKKGKKSERGNADKRNQQIQKALTLIKQEQNTRLTRKTKHKHV